MLQPLIIGLVFKFELVNEVTLSTTGIEFLENDLAYSCERPEVRSDNHWLFFTICSEEAFLGIQAWVLTRSVRALAFRRHLVDRLILDRIPLQPSLL